MEDGAVLVEAGVTEAVAEVFLSAVHEDVAALATAEVMHAPALDRGVALQALGPILDDLGHVQVP